MPTISVPECAFARHADTPQAPCQCPVNSVKFALSTAQRLLQDEMEALIQRLGQLEEALRAKDLEIAKLMADNARLAANAMTDETKERLRLLETENERLFDELARTRIALKNVTLVRASSLSGPQPPPTWETCVRRPEQVTRSSFTAIRIPSGGLVCCLWAAALASWCIR